MLRKPHFWWVLLPLILIAAVFYRLNLLKQNATSEEVVKRTIKVETIVLSPQPLSAWVFSEGTVQAHQKAFLDFELGGKVESIATLADGTHLREGIRVFGPAEGTRHGQLLAQIDNRDNLAAVQSLQARLQSMRAQKSEAETKLQQAKNEQRLSEQNFSRMKEVYERGVISQDEFDRIKTANLNAHAAVQGARSGIQSIESELASLTAELNRATLNLEKTSLFAPFDGVITAMNISENNHYYPPISSSSDKEREAASAIVIVDDSQLEIQLEINVKEAEQLKEGLTVYLASEDERLYAAERKQRLGLDVTQGTVWSVSPAINLQRRTQTVKVRVKQEQTSLKEGQFVRAWIETSTLADAISLPLHALSFRNGKPFVYVIDPHTQIAERRDIQLGLQSIDRVEILHGLIAGERVVVRGQHLLVNGSSVTVIGEK
ncbi:efflux RND transporter periplasmic adaptor subunit [Thaumasiovibrio subtropicus]|uniref:efflux RND transporter periplasmic adaptor subunit n=1 Tax=Thaumasiovibrio subtropicus TaxID=1891207 RepID=UPI000B34D282|nr:efflux RND transporter periplasmic adaptor subunit [Thaumasiovibrio subtropicus]